MRDRESERERERERERESLRQQKSLFLLQTRQNPGNTPTNCYRLGQYNPSSVDSLEDTKEVDSSCDFLDEHGSHTLGTQLLVDTEEIDFHHWLCTTVAKGHDTKLPAIRTAVP